MGEIYISGNQYYLYIMCMLGFHIVVILLRWWYTQVQIHTSFVSLIACVYIMLSNIFFYNVLACNIHCGNVILLLGHVYAFLCSGLVEQFVIEFVFILQTIFFLWFALSGWLFRCIILATWVLPFAAPLLIGAVANNFVIEVNFYFTSYL